MRQMLPFLDSYHCLLKPHLPGKVGMSLTTATSSSALKHILETQESATNKTQAIKIPWLTGVAFHTLSVPYVPASQRF